MAVPDFQSMMLPFLRRTADGVEYKMADIRQKLAEEFRLSDTEIKELLPSGRQSRFANRVAWAKVYLAQAGLLETPRRGVFKISRRGHEVLSNPPPAIDIRFLEQYPEFLKFRRQPKKDKPSRTDYENAQQGAETPEEALEQAALRRITFLKTSENLFVACCTAADAGFRSSTQPKRSPS